MHHAEDAVCQQPAQTNHRCSATVVVTLHAAAFVIALRAETQAPHLGQVDANAAAGWSSRQGAATGAGACPPAARTAPAAPTCAGWR